MAVKEPRVVAELGRPETPQETADRKAQNSRNYRDSKTVRNLLIALGVSVLLVVVIALIVPRPDTTLTSPVDWHPIAQQAGSSYADPTLPAGWSANAAEFRGDNGTHVWYIGFITPGHQFIGFEQHPTPDANWLQNNGDKTTLSAPTAVTVGPATWQTYTHTGDTTSNYATIWESQGTKQQFLLYGTGTPAEFQTLATAIERWIG